jgi:hypothetical protein
MNSKRTATTNRPPNWTPPDRIENTASTGIAKANCGDTEGVVNREISELQREINLLKEVTCEIYTRVEQVAVPGPKSDCSDSDKNCKPYSIVSPVAERLRATRSVIEEMVSNAKELLGRLEV